ncbi:hypothetical protein SAMN06297144_1223 [Sphingomonas guangdongensis]|uniref:Uncharacterized protein n=1 Tax=Sphingomonas guangdongensis TaxID=1141890 RepID=A0A285QFQ0_9SPHN|nr:hypothetical protein [Sphingomonas guangdongensis]SOB80760.1 hypothetical protein SAMN06297144_1223 [Sphingomonas guangdongensis]
MSALTKKPNGGRFTLEDLVDQPGAKRILELILSMALAPGGEVSPDNESLVALRREGTREQVLQDLVALLAPRNVNPALWLKWLSGDGEPYTPSKLARAGSSKHASGRVLDRASDRIGTQRQRRDRARTKLEEAREELDREEQALATAQAMDNAVLMWAVSEHLARIIGPVFAMGPAWTLMRICSAHITRSDMDEELSRYSEGDQEYAEEQFRRDRTDQSALILDALDLWSGDDEFEHEMRMAISDVARRYRVKKRDQSSVPPRKRSARDKTNSARPDAATDRNEVLDGFAADPGSDRSNVGSASRAERDDDEERFY